MIEPTETQTRESLEEYGNTLLQIAQEARTNPDMLHAAPHNAPVTRLDDVKAAREPVLRHKHKEPQAAMKKPEPEPTA